MGSQLLLEAHTMEDSSQPTVNPVDQAYKTFVRYLEQTRSRLTRPRLKVARWLLEVDEVFQERDVNEWIKTRGLPIGPRSVNKTIELLVNCGLLLRLSHEFDPFYLSLARRKPGTLCLVCVDCLKLQDHPLPKGLAVSRRIAQTEGYKLACAFQIVRGRCKDCRRKR